MEVQFEQLVPLEDAARVLHIPVRRLREQEPIPIVQIGERTRRVRARDLAAFIAAGGIRQREGRR